MNNEQECSATQSSHTIFHQHDCLCFKAVVRGMWSFKLKSSRSNTKILSCLKRQKSGQSLYSNKSQISLLPDERAPPDGLLS